MEVSGGPTLAYPVSYLVLVAYPVSYQRPPGGAVGVGVARGRGERGEGARAALRASGSGPQFGLDPGQPCPLLFFEKKSQAYSSKTRSSLVARHAARRRRAGLAARQAEEERR